MTGKSNTSKSGVRVIIPHNKSRQEVIDRVDRSFQDVFRTAATGLVQIADPQKNWDGNTMTFSLTAKAGFLNAPIKGTVLVTDKDITIDADFGIFEKFISAEKARTAIEGGVRGLLN
jgi:hypothetical protein